MKCNHGQYVLLNEYTNDASSIIIFDGLCLRCGNAGKYSVRKSERPETIIDTFLNSEKEILKEFPNIREKYMNYLYKNGYSKEYAVYLLNLECYKENKLDKEEDKKCR